MYRSITLKRGLDLKLRGGLVAGAKAETVKPDRVAMVPDDFPGFTPRVAVKAGDHIDAGQALMTDKINPAVAIVSPVGGTVEAIQRSTHAARCSALWSKPTKARRVWPVRESPAARPKASVKRS